MIERKIKVNPKEKIVRYYWGLSWPTLIVGAITVVSIALGGMWLIKALAAVAANDPNF